MSFIYKHGNARVFRRQSRDIIHNRPNQENGLRRENELRRENGLRRENERLKRIRNNQKNKINIQNVQINELQDIISTYNIKETEIDKLQAVHDTDMARITVALQEELSSHDETKEELRSLKRNNLELRKQLMLESVKYKENVDTKDSEIKILKETNKKFRHQIEELEKIYRELLRENDIVKNINLDYERRMRTCESESVSDYETVCHICRVCPDLEKLTCGHKICIGCKTNLETQECPYCRTQIN